MNKFLSGLSSCVALLGIFFNTNSNGQTINTIAGNGIGSYSGDGAAATAAGIDWPTRTAMDGSGNLYFTDYSNALIRKINTAGIISTYAGNGMSGYSGDGGPATAASINDPTGMAVDIAGNIYTSDYHGYRVRKVNTSGIISTIAGNGTLGYSGDGGPATLAQITTPWGIVTDAAGNIFFSDRLNHCIRKINAAGIISTIAGDGIAGFSGDGGPATAARLNQPVDLTFDATGNLYFSDGANNRVRKISTSGVISTVAGNGTGGYTGDGGAALSAQMNFPVGLGIDGAGNIYVGDYLNSAVRKINTSGIITTIAGNGTMGYGGDGGPATAAVLNKPQGVAVYGSDVYICDVQNNRIRKVIGGNTPPVFSGGPIQSLTVCTSVSVPTVSINTLLAIVDPDLAQSETWTLLTPPTNGTVVAAYTALSTGGTLTPSGLSYTPTAGYIGPDMFIVVVNDGSGSDTTTINIMVQPYPNAGIISGIDSVCPGRKVTLSETVTTGIWSSSNPSIATIASTGIVTGIAPGIDTIIYTVINSCGIVSAIFPIKVLSHAFCRTGLTQLQNAGNEGLRIYPNPNNGVFKAEFLSGSDETAQFVLMNSVGQKIKEFSGNANQKIDIEMDSPPGIYFLAVSGASSSYFVKITLTR